MATDNHGLNWGLPISQNIITLPETVVKDLTIPTGKILKPLLDLIWNACGKAASINFDAEGNRIDRR